jgi:2-polyprenyl-3-methyl-5-hydroxy-6-metoxy-1,4-benzoquinol methylase
MTQSASPNDIFLPTLDDAWPESWKISHHYDQLEVLARGGSTELGYITLYQERVKHVTAALRGIPRGAMLLDVAAAQGNFSLCAARLGFRVTWNDLREELQGYVRLKDTHGLLTYRPGEISSLVGSERYDVVMALEVIEHTAHPDQFLRSLAALLKPGGRIVISTPNGGYFRNNLPRFSDCADPSAYEGIQYQPNADGHIFLLDADELLLLAEKAGLSTIELITYGLPSTAGHCKTLLLHRLLPRPVLTTCEWASKYLPSSISRRIHYGIVAVFG